MIRKNYRKDEIFVDQKKSGRFTCEDLAEQIQKEQKTLEVYDNSMLPDYAKKIYYPLPD